MSELKAQLPDEIADAIGRYGMASADILNGRPRAAREALEAAILAWNTRAPDSRVGELEAQVARLKSALEPSGDTKAAYMGEFFWKEWAEDEDGQEREFKVYVPWTAIKEIMKAISARAALGGLSHD